MLTIKGTGREALHIFTCREVVLDLYDVLKDIIRLKTSLSVKIIALRLFVLGVKDHSGFNSSLWEFIQPIYLKWRKS